MTAVALSAPTPVVTNVPAVMPVCPCAVKAPTVPTLPTSKLPVVAVTLAVVPANSAPELMDPALTPSDVAAVIVAKLTAAALMLMDDEVLCTSVPDRVPPALS